MHTALSAKIHRATITQADLQYEGSITVSKTLLEQASIYNYEQVHVWNVTRGSRVITYAIEGPKNSSDICINGAAAHLNEPGDIVIISAFKNLSLDELKKHVPTVIFVDEKNRVKEVREEKPGPLKSK